MAKMTEAQYQAAANGAATKAPRAKKATSSVLQLTSMHCGATVSLRLLSLVKEIPAKNLPQTVVVTWPHTGDVQTFEKVSQEGVHCTYKATAAHPKYDTLEINGPIRD